MAGRRGRSSDRPLSSVPFLPHPGAEPGPALPSRRPCLTLQGPPLHPQARPQRCPGAAHDQRCAGWARGLDYRLDSGPPAPWLKAEQAETLPCRSL